MNYRRPHARRRLDEAWSAGQSFEIETCDCDAYRMAAKRGGYVIRVERLSENPDRLTLWIMSKPGLEWKLVNGEWREVLKTAVESSTAESPAVCPE